MHSKSERRMRSSLRKKVRRLAPARAHHLLGSLAHLVALPDQLPVGRRQLLQTQLQCLQHWLVLLALAGQAFDQFAAEVARAALVALALLEHFQVGEAVGPGQKRLIRVVIGELTVQRDARFLQHVARIFLVRQQGEDVAEQLVLMLG